MGMGMGINKNQTVLIQLKPIALFIGLSLAQPSLANNVLIYNNSFGDNDLDLGALQQAAGNTVTYVNAGDPLPDLSSFSQVWDISFKDSIPSSDSNAYLSYLQGGGAIFLLGEHYHSSNTGNIDRHNSLITFIDSAGGGTTSISGNDFSSQIVNSDLQTPNTITTVSYGGAGLYSTIGSGKCLTSKNANACSAIAFDVGTLTNAPNGSLVSVLDVNFLDTDGSYGRPLLTENIIAYLLAQAQAGQAAAQSSGEQAPAISVLNSSKILVNFPAYRAAAILDATPELLALFTGAGLSNDRDISDAASETLPLITGGSVIVADSSLFAINNIVEARIAGNTGMSSGDGFLGDRHIWMKPFTSWADQDDRNGVTGYDAETKGMVFGIDSTINDITQIGLSFGYATATVDSGSTDAPHSLSTDVYQLNGYGSYTIDNRTEASFRLGYGQNRNDGRRNIAFTNTVARSHYESKTVQLGAKIARHYQPVGHLDLVASAYFGYTYIRDDGYTETGAGILNLDVEANTHDSLVVGLNGQLSFPLDNLGTLRGNAGVGYDLYSRNVVVTAAYTGAPAASFDTEGLDQRPWIFDAGLAYVYSSENGIEISLEYDLQYRQDFLNHTAAIKFTWPF